MKSARLRIWLGVLGGAALLLCVVCGIGVWLAFRGSQQALTTSDQTAQQLLQALQHHRWQVAQQHFTPQAQTRFTPAVLQQRWHLVEQATGTVQRWVRTKFQIYAGTGGQRMDLQYRLEGVRGVGVARMRLLWAGGRWLVEELEFSW